MEVFYLLFRILHVYFTITLAEQKTIYSKENSIFLNKNHLKANDVPKYKTGRHL